MSKESKFHPVGSYPPRLQEIVDTGRAFNEKSKERISRERRMRERERKSAAVAAEKEEEQQDGLQHKKEKEEEGVEGGGKELPVRGRKDEREGL